MDQREIDSFYKSLSADDQEVNDALAFVEELRRQEDVQAPPADDTSLTVEEDNVQNGQISLSAIAKHRTPTPHKRHRRPLEALIPYHGDPIMEIARKLLLVISLLVFVGALSVLLNEAVIIPQQNATLAQELSDIRYGRQDPELTAQAEAWEGYPSGIRDDLKTLYYLNGDIRGWLKYSACGIDREVMYSADNDYYLTHDFYRNPNKNGALFFDANNKLNAAGNTNKSLVIYGHNMASGQMFAKLNNLASSLSTMKNANQIITLDTLFDTRQYKIFAVVLQDSNAKLEHYYSIQATSFTNNDQFTKYVDGLRARSLYDFDVDVKATDELLILYTCTPKSIAQFDDARLAVIARRVRSGEAAKPAANVTTNKDVIMPYRWYTAQKKTPHEYYSGKGTIPPTTTKPGTTTTKPGTSTTKPIASTTAKPSTTVNNSGSGTTTTKPPVTTTTVTTTAATTTTTTTATTTATTTTTMTTTATTTTTTTTTTTATTAVTTATDNS